MTVKFQRILMIKLDSLGDIVHTLPMMHALRRCFPECFIGWIVQQAFVPLLECDPAVEAVLPITNSSSSDPHASRKSDFLSVAFCCRYMESHSLS